MEAIISAVFGAFFGTSTLKLILTLIVLIIGWRLSKKMLEREQEKVVEETAKKRIEDQASVDIPNSKLESDYQKSQDEIRDIFGGDK